MRIAHRAWVVAALLAAALIVPAAAVEPLLREDPRIQALQGDEKARLEASGHLVEVGPPAIPALLSVLEDENRTAAKAAEMTLDAIVHAAAGTSHASSVAEVLARELQGQDTAEVRREVCRLLSFIGDAGAVAALERGMDDLDVREMARWALIRIGGGQAADVLIKRLQTHDGAWQVAVINALGEIGDTRAVPPLVKLAGSEEDDVARAARGSLARLPHAESLQALRQALLSRQPGAAGDFVLLAENLLDAGMLKEAEEAVAVIILAGGHLTTAEGCALMHAVGRLGHQDAATYLLEEVFTDDVRLRSCVLEAIGTLKGKTATARIAQVMKGSPPPLKAQLLGVLGFRGQEVPEEAAGLIADAVQDADETVRLAAIGAIRTAGIAGGVPALLDVLGGPAGSAREAAERALYQMPGDAATQAIMVALPGRASQVRAAMLQALGHRGGIGLLPALEAASEDESPEVRAAAFAAMVHTPEAVEVLLARLKGPAGPDRDAAMQTLARLPGEAATLAMLAAYQGFPEGNKPFLLRAIGHRQHPEVSRLLVREARSPDVHIRAAAVTGMGHTGDPAVASALLAAAQAGPAKVTHAALEGYLRAADRIAPDDAPAALRMYSEALPLAIGDEQQRQALRGMNRTLNPQDVQLLDRVRPFLDQPATAVTAILIAARVAVHLPEARRDEAVEILTRAVRTVAVGPVRQQAFERLLQLGVDIDPAREAGFITQWWLIGPFPNPDNAMWSKAYAPEQGVDLGWSAQVGDTTLSWMPHRTMDVSGIVDLEKAVARRDNVGAYAFTRIRVDYDRDVVLKVGSDDSVAVWLNGEQVHAKLINRGVGVDQDHVPARLRAGENTLLLKVLNGGGGWGFVLRVADLDDQPLTFSVVGTE